MTFEQFCNLIQHFSPGTPLLIYNDMKGVACAGYPHAAAYVLYARDNGDIRIRFAIDNPAEVAKELRTLPGVKAFAIPDYPGVVFSVFAEDVMSEQIYLVYKHYLAQAITKFLRG